MGAGRGPPPPAPTASFEGKRRMSAKGYVVTGGGGGGPHTHPWSDITGEPTTYPPDSHTHPEYEGGGGSTAWGDITGKPTEFPPEDHAHAVTDVTNLQVLLDGKSGTGHTHSAPAWTDITGKPATFPPTSHTHTVEEVVDLEGILAALESPDWADITGKPATFPPSTHSHGDPAWSSITGKPTEFPPEDHAHSSADITDLAATLTPYALLASPAFTGNPTAPTQSAGNNSTRVATTAYVDSAVAAGGGGGGGAGLPNSIYPVASRWFPFPVGRVGSNRTMEVGRGFFAPLPMAAAGTLDQLALEVVTAGAAGAVVRLVLWTAGSDRVPMVSFRDLGTVATDSTGVKTITGIAQAVAANTLYWVCAVAQTATCVVRAISSYNAYVFDDAVFSGTGETSHLAMFGGLTGAVANGTAFVLEGSENGPRMAARFS